MVPDSDTARPQIDWSLIPVGEHARWTAAWDALDASGWRTPMLASWFVLPAIQHFGSGAELVAVGTRRGGLVVSMAILSPVSPLRWEVFQPAQLPMAALLMSSGERFDRIAPSLLRALPWTVAALTFAHLDSELVPMPASARQIDVKEHMLTGTITVGPSFEAYYRSRSASLRKNVEKRRRKAESLYGPAELEVWTDAGRVDEFIRLYSATETSGWKGRAGTSVQLDDPQGRFYRDVLLSAAARGAARMIVLRFGAQAVAQYLAIEEDEVVYLMKTSYDETFSAFGPGVIQRLLTLQWGASRPPPVQRYEIYGRVNESQRPFLTGTRPVYHATVFRHPLTRRLVETIQRVRRGSAKNGEVTAGVEEGSAR